MAWGRGRAHESIRETMIAKPEELAAEPANHFSRRASDASPALLTRSFSVLKRSQSGATAADTQEWTVLAISARIS